MVVVVFLVEVVLSVAVLRGDGGGDGGGDLPQCAFEPQMASTARCRQGWSRSRGCTRTLDAMFYHPFSFTLSPSPPANLPHHSPVVTTTQRLELSRIDCDDDDDADGKETTDHCSDVFFNAQTNCIYASGSLYEIVSSWRQSH